MINRGFYVIDGSRLFSSIHELWRIRPKYNKKKLRLGELTEALIRKWSINLAETTRVIYYFKKNGSRIRNMLEVPDCKIPGEKDHWQIKECGENLKSVPEKELQKLSAKYRDHFARSEKGLDTQLVCDVLVLVSTGRASNIVFLVNDRDYVPLFESIQYLGGNVYLTALDSKQPVQRGLADLCDKFLTLDNELPNIFGIKIPKEKSTQLKKGKRKQIKSDLQKI